MESTVFDSFKSCMNSSLIMPHSTLSFSIQILGFLKITTNKNVGILCFGMIQKKELFYCMSNFYYELISYCL